MLNSVAESPWFEGGEEVDLDRMAAEIERLAGLRGTTELRSHIVAGEWLKPVGRVVKPSFGGRIEPQVEKFLEDGEERFRCGR